MFSQPGSQIPSSNENEFENISQSEIEAQLATHNDLYSAYIDYSSTYTIDQLLQEANEVNNNNNNTDFANTNNSVQMMSIEHDKIIQNLQNALKSNTKSSASYSLSKLKKFYLFNQAFFDFYYGKSAENNLDPLSVYHPKSHIECFRRFQILASIPKIGIYISRALTDNLFLIASISDTSPVQVRDIMPGLLSNMNYPGQHLKLLEDFFGLLNLEDLKSLSFSKIPRCWQTHIAKIYVTKNAEWSSSNKRKAEDVGVEATRLRRNFINDFAKNYNFKHSVENISQSITEALQSTQKNIYQRELEAQQALNELEAQLASTDDQDFSYISNSTDNNNNNNNSTRNHNNTSSSNTAVQKLIEEHENILNKLNTKQIASINDLTNYYLTNPEFFDWYYGKFSNNLSPLADCKPADQTQCFKRFETLVRIQGTLEHINQAYINNPLLHCSLFALSDIDRISFIQDLLFNLKLRKNISLKIIKYLFDLLTLEDIQKVSLIYPQWRSVINKYCVSRKNQDKKMVYRHNAVAAELGNINDNNNEPIQNVTQSQTINTAQKSNTSILFQPNSSIWLSTKIKLLNDASLKDTIIRLFSELPQYIQYSFLQDDFTTFILPASLKSIFENLNKVDGSPVWWKQNDSPSKITIKLSLYKQWFDAVLTPCYQHYQQSNNAPTLQLSTSSV